MTEDIYHEARKVANDNKEITGRIIHQTKETQKCGTSTLNKLHEQGQSSNEIADDISEGNDKLNLFSSCFKFHHKKKNKNKIPKSRSLVTINQFLDDTGVEINQNLEIIDKIINEDNEDNENVILMEKKISLKS